MDARRGGLRPRSPLNFFLLVFAFSVPFWVLGAVIDVAWLPGLPLSAFGTVCPLLAALVLVHGEHGTTGMVALLKRAFDFRRIRRKRWYIPTVLLMPGVSVLVYWLNLSWMLFPVHGSFFDLRLASLVMACVVVVAVVVRGWP